MSSPKSLILKTIETLDSNFLKTYWAQSRELIRKSQGIRVKKSRWRRPEQIYAFCKFHGILYRNVLRTFVRMDVRNMDVFVLSSAVPGGPNLYTAVLIIIHTKRTYLYPEMILLLSWKKTLDCISKWEWSLCEFDDALFLNFKKLLPIVCAASTKNTLFGVIPVCRKELSKWTLCCDWGLE